MTKLSLGEKSAKKDLMKETPPSANSDYWLSPLFFIMDFGLIALFILIVWGLMTI